MAIRLERSGTLVLVAAKTGGTWLREALTAGRIRWREEGPADAGGQEGLEAHSRAGNFIATFVRNPVDWYRSYWAYRMEGGWRPRFHLDRSCAAEDFTQFVRNVVVRFPGFLTAMFERYAGPAGNPVDYIGRQENLADDLVSLLTLRGEEFDEAALRATPPANRTSLRPAIGAGLVDVINVSEQEMMRRFDYEWHDALALNEAQDRFTDDSQSLRRLVLWTERTHWAPDDEKRAQGRTDVDDIRAARCRSNFALFAHVVRSDTSFAVRCFEAALDLAPRHPRTLSNYAAFRADCLNDDEGAEALFKRALSARPDHPHTLLLYEKFLASRGRQADAEHCRVQLESLGPRLASIQSSAALLFSTDAQ